MSDTDITSHPTVIEMTLAALIDRSLNRFDAERIHNHCLHSTVSDLSNRYGLLIERHPEAVRNFLGGKTRVVRYRISSGERPKAMRLLRHLEKQRQQRSQ